MAKADANTNARCLCRTQTRTGIWKITGPIAKTATVQVGSKGTTMNEDEVKKKIEIAGAIGAIFGFASGVALMTLVSIIF